MIITVWGFDPGTKFGWSQIVGEPEGPYTIDSGVWDLSPPKRDPADPAGCRYYTLWNCMMRQIQKAIPGLIVVEQVHHRGRAATEYAYGYLATIRHWAYLHGIKVRTVHSGTLKKFATGNGKASKEDMVDAAEGLWFPWTAQTDDEADARWIAHWGLKEMQA